jgi:Fe-S cluster biogenesis protein NfuA
MTRATSTTHDLNSRIEALLDDLESHTDPAVCWRVQELLRAVSDLYGAGLSRVWTHLADEADGPARLRRLAADDLVRGLLLLHDLHPDDVETRIRDALERIRPLLGSHAGGLDLLGVDAHGVVQLRLAGSGQGCPSSLATLQATVERAVLEAAPEVERVEVARVVEPTGPTLIQIQPYRPPGDTPSRGGGVTASGVRLP